ncbi:uncharacterized protein LOC121747690 [Salvia splendens]|uniref:uncharacterized protein LOC121747690 n=1 Tax=Salvia splendens TaxID=180675 RepID=UPI001C26A02A|nr:uncharacterized protein LOC121747690 [Salvia splendens]
MLGGWRWGRLTPPGSVSDYSPSRMESQAAPRSLSLNLRRRSSQQPPRLQARIGPPTQSSNAFPLLPPPPRLVRRWIFQDICISTSDQIGGSIYSSGLVSIGIGAMPQTLEIGSDDIEPVGSQIPIQATDGTFQLRKRTWKCCTSWDKSHL